MLFLLGVAKAGSSSIFNMLIKHPDFCAASKSLGYVRGHKEQHFFSVTKVYALGVHKYKSIYTDPKCNTSRGIYIDGSPTFRSMHVMVPRMKETYTVGMWEKLKFIVVLREPVSRDISWYKHSTRSSLSTSKFTEIKTAGEKNSSHQFNMESFYYNYLSTFLKAFRRDQILLLSFDYVAKNNKLTMMAIAKFLNVPFIEEWGYPLPDEDHLSQYGDKVDCVLSHVPPVECSLRNTMRDIYKPMNEKLYKLLEDTKHQRHMAEPDFLEFMDPNVTTPCVDDPRTIYNELISTDKIGHC
jgi:hypothetical protein